MNNCPGTRLDAGGKNRRPARGEAPRSPGRWRSQGALARGRFFDDCESPLMGLNLEDTSIPARTVQGVRRIRVSEFADTGVEWVDRGHGDLNLGCLSDRDRARLTRRYERTA